MKRFFPLGSYGKQNAVSATPLKNIRKQTKKLLLNVQKR